MLIMLLCRLKMAHDGGGQYGSIPTATTGGAFLSRRRFDRRLHVVVRVVKKRKLLVLLGVELVGALRLIHAAAF
jgi:hypothetical protein